MRCSSSNPLFSRVHLPKSRPDGAGIRPASGESPAAYGKVAVVLSGMLLPWLLPTTVWGQQNLLRNPGFEEQAVEGAIPPGWQAVDENFEYWGWIAPRVERKIGTVVARSGRFMAGLDTEMMGVDTNGTEYHIPRSALFQTVTVPGKTRGRFSIYYNDLGSSALSHVSALRLAYSVDHAEIRRIEFPAGKGHKPDSGRLPQNLWSEPFFRVSQRLPTAYTAVGDWSFAAIDLVVNSNSQQVALTVWIGVFDHQNSTEIGYWRIDDAALILEPPPAAPSTENHSPSTRPGN